MLSSMLIKYACIESISKVERVMKEPKENPPKRTKEEIALMRKEIQMEME